MNWECPYCGSHTTLIKSKSIEFTEVTSKVPGFDLDPKLPNHQYQLNTVFIACPNQECRKLTLKATLSKSKREYIERARNYLNVDSEEIKRWNLLPDGNYKQFPDYIPEPIRNDYKEACLIKKLSPKASATLSRRCLQGMIRDFWDVSDRTLFLEIETIKDKIDPDIWGAIDSLRKLGNIGAHMEKDINVIVDIDDGEAEQLIGLIELLMEEWYIIREKRKNRLKGVVALSDQKKEERGE